MKKANAITAISLVLAASFVMSSCALMKPEGFRGPMVGKQAEKPAATLEDNAPQVSSGEDAGLAEDQAVVDINFDDNDVDGFTVFTDGGDLTLSAQDGMLVCSIGSCGKKDYANQAYWDGFELAEGCEYTYSFDIYSDIDRQIEYRLQLNGGDYHAYQGEYIQIGPEVTNFSVDFTMEEASDPAPRLVFNMGKMDDMTEDPGSHKVYIDNVKLVIKDAANAQTVAMLPTYLNVNVNQIGYLPEDTKTVFVKTDADLEDFYVVNNDTGLVVYQGKLGGAVGGANYDPASQMNVAKGDFSEVTDPGTYYIYTNAGSSYTFKIGTDVYDDIYSDVVLMLYRQRCGTELDPAIAGDFAHGACHTEEAVIYGTNQTKDVSGGWHDAGDYGKYVVSGAKAVADLLVTYEDYGVKADDLGLPESGNGVPDLLDEARYELEWMLKMQDEESGGVYHKVTGMVFCGMVMPEEDTEELVIAPISTTATADFAAVMAKASVVYKDIDADFSASCYDAAVKAWAYIADVEDTTGFINPEGMDTGEYPDPNALDEQTWAAAELYLACQAGVTGADASDASAYADFIQNAWNGEFVDGLGWLDVGMYAEYDLAKSKTDLAETAKSRLLAEADKLITLASQDAYKQSLGTNYYWGSNMGIANNGMILYMAANVSEGADATKYKTAASYELDYLLGANAMGYCFVTGYGTFSPSDTHHRPSQAMGVCMPGMLVGGACAELADPYAKMVLADEAPSMCYVDSSQSYSTNEVTVYWNSPLIYIMSAELA